MKNKSTTHRIIINTITGWISVGLRLAIALALVPLLLTKMGTDGYGLIGLISVIVGFSTIADMGLRKALGRELSQKVASGDVSGFRSLTSTALLLYLALAAILITVEWILAPWFITIFNVEKNIQVDALWLIRIYGSITVLLSFISPIFTASLQSFLRFDFINNVTSVKGIIAGILLFIGLIFSDIAPLIVWATVMLSLHIAELVVLWLFYKKNCYSGKLNLKYFDYRELKPLFKLGGSMYILQLTSALAERSDPLVISYFFGTFGVALYQSGAKLSQTLRPLVLTLSNQMHPLTTRFHVLSQADKQKKALILGTRYTLVIGLCFSAGILLFSDSFCKLWLFSSLNSDYMTVSRIMKLLALASIFDYAAAMHWPTLLGMKKLKFAISVQIPASIFNIAVSIYLVGFTEWGISGVLVATIISGALRRPLFIWYVCRMTRLSIKEYINTAYLPPLIQFIMLLLFYPVLKHFTIQSWIQFVSVLGLFTVHVAVVLFLVEKRLFVSLVNHWRGI